MKIWISVVLIIMLIALCLTSCTQAGGPGKISEDDLANLEYKIEITSSGKAKLDNGRYSEEAAPGSASKIEVNLTENMDFGDLNSNGIEDAAVILMATGGGSGTFYYLSAVINETEGLKSSNSLFLGDRIEISNVLVDSGLITVEYLERTLEQSFAEDPAVRVTRKFKVQDSSLVMVSQTMALGEDSISMSLDTKGLPYTWQSYLVEETSYNNDISAGQQGLPKHLQIRLLPVDEEDITTSNPVIYIIPAEEYRQLWEENGDQSVSITLDSIQKIIEDRPDSSSIAQIPVLPFEELNGADHISAYNNYLEFDKWGGARFLEYIPQEPDSISNEEMRYIFQGFTGESDQYLVAFFFPVTNPGLPDTIDTEPDEEGMIDDPLVYFQEIADLLNGMEESDWEPDPAQLDEMLSSLDIEVTFGERETAGDEDAETIGKKGIVDRITAESIEIDVNGRITVIYLYGYKLPHDLSAGDEVHVEYVEDTQTGQNTLKYLEILEKNIPAQAPTIKLDIISGPTYVPYDSTCYYRVEATTTGSPEPYITWSRDDSKGSLGSEKAQVNLYKIDEKYTLTATAKNSAGLASASIELKWGCNRPPVIEEIVIEKEHLTDKTYPVSVKASDPDGDKLSYKWSISGGTIKNVKSNPTDWTTPSKPGFYDIKVTVDDGKGGKTSKTIKVEVKKPEEPPLEPPILIGTEWQWEVFTSDEGILIVEDPFLYTLVLLRDGNFNVLADCNTGNGIYARAGDILKLDLTAITKALCDEESLSEQYIYYLEEVVSYDIDKEGKLNLYMEDDEGIMQFGILIEDE